MNSILPLKWQFPSWRLSPHLTVKTEKTADGIRTYYVNSKGVITVTLDKNYASVDKPYDQEGNCILERYFDDHGRPAILPAGHTYRFPLFITWLELSLSIRPADE